MVEADGWCWDQDDKNCHKPLVSWSVNRLQAVVLDRFSSLFRDIPNKSHDCNNISPSSEITGFIIHCYYWPTKHLTTAFLMSKKQLDIRDKTIFDGVIGKYFLKVIFKVWFKLSGWQPIKSDYEGAGVTIAAPHTSNWDVVYAMGAAILLDIKIYFTIKESWCQIPVIGRIMLWLGAIPVSRQAGGQGQIARITRFVDKHKNQQIFFLFTPEGTRGKVNKWKTGFYHTAKGCDLPIFLAKVDFKNKQSGVFHTFQLTDNMDDDIRSIQESYKKIRGKYPELQYPAYTGPLPEFSELEAKILKAVYLARGVVSQVDIAARLKAQQLSKAMLDFLIEKGFLESTSADGSEPRYRLTFAGKGCLLHLYPALHESG